MKLKNFAYDNGLNTLRKGMSADLNKWSSNVSWRIVELEDALTAFGEVEVPFSALKLEEDKTFTLRGKKVLVYIRDQNSGYYAKGYKFHISNCGTLIEYQNNGRYSKYVASIRKDGVFKVNLMTNGRLVEADKLEELKVCKNCLEALNYKGYNHLHSLDDKNLAVATFKIDEFFSLYTHQNVHNTKHTDVTSPVDEYVEDWPKISNSYKKRQKFICENCEIDLKNKPSFLDTHHISGHKADNRDENLKALCIKCHSNEPGHGHMTNLDRFKEFIRLI